MFHSLRKTKAFSLLELMIVIVILGMLAGLIMPDILSKGEEAKTKMVCVQMEGMEKSLDMFKLDNSKYPEMDEGLNALLSNPDAEKYPNYSKSAYLKAKSVPKDPWNNEYLYLNNEGEIDIVSLGADGKDGGTDDNADVSLSKNCQK